MLNLCFFIPTSKTLIYNSIFDILLLDSSILQFFFSYFSNFINCEMFLDF